jgi:hypothetical protein
MGRDAISYAFQCTSAACLSNMCWVVWPKAASMCLPAALAGWLADRRSSWRPALPPTPVQWSWLAPCRPIPKGGTRPRVHRHWGATCRCA